MKKLVLALSFALAAMPLALTSNVHAQSVVLNGLGSSALFLEAGLGTQKTPISAVCWWTGNNSAAAGNVVTATDTKNSSSLVPPVTDSGMHGLRGRREAEAAWPRRALRRFGHTCRQTRS